MAPRSSTPMCCMNDGSAIANGFASALADAGATLKRWMTARRVGSEQRAEDLRQSGIDRVTLRHTPNYVVSVMLWSRPDFHARFDALSIAGAARGPTAVPVRSGW